MWHDIVYGMLLGYGAAVPIGPMNIEMVRRNLLYGSKIGISFGLGACFVDMTFMVLLGLGILTLFANQGILKFIGFLGALILLWFAYKAWNAPVQLLNLNEYPRKDKPWWRHFLESYLLTLFNPYTILFWSSVSTQAAILVAHSSHAFWLLAPSVLIAAISWVLGLNLALNITRERISAKTMRLLNHLGAIVLIGFAAYGLSTSF